MSELLVVSEITGELSPCTMSQGVLLQDGTRLGAIADIDVFGSFTFDLTQMKSIRTDDDGNILESAPMFDQEECRNMIRRGTTELWTLRKIGENVTIQSDEYLGKKNRRANRTERSMKVDSLRAFYEANESAGLSPFEN